MNYKNEKKELILEIKDLKVHFDTDEGLVKSVDGVDLKIAKGTTLGLVGESGCGKSITCLSILRLIPSPPGVIAGGEIIYKTGTCSILPKRRWKVYGAMISA